MPRTARAIEADGIYHVLNRGNGKMRLFHKPGDFDAFERVLAEGLARYPVDLLTYCLMGNHWHLALRPRHHEALGRLISWVGVTHVRRHRAHYRNDGGGHLYQGRFKSFPVQDDRHFLTLCRYVEANPLRARLVRQAEDWRWSGLHARANRRGPLFSLLREWPVDRPSGWGTLVNRSLESTELDRLRTSVARGRPYGADRWVEQAARRLGLMFTLRSRGRPRKGETGIEKNE